MTIEARKINQPNKYELGDKVLYKGQTGIITAVYFHDETSEEVWYEVKVTARTKSKGYWGTPEKYLKFR